jgi:hypothetical protein
MTEINKYELTVKTSKEIESMLEKYWHAEGRGLREKLDSVEKHMSPFLFKKIRHIAYVRNNFMHNDDFDFEVKSFLKDRENVITKLKLLANEQRLIPDKISKKPIINNTNQQQKDSIKSPFKTKTTENKSHPVTHTYDFPLVLFLAVISLTFFVSRSQSQILLIGMELVCSWLIIRYILKFLNRANFGWLGWIIVWSFSTIYTPLTTIAKLGVETTNFNNVSSTQQNLSTQNKLTPVKKIEQETTKLISDAEITKKPHKKDPSTTAESNLGLANITIRSNVYQDSVKINNVYKGSTRLDLKLKNGIYDIVVSKPGYQNWTTKINVKNAQQQTIYAKLKKNTVNNSEIQNNQILSTTIVKQKNSLQHQLLLAKEEKAVAFNKIKQDVIDTLHKNIQISIDEPGFKNNNNKTFDVSIPVNWKIDDDTKIISTLKENFKIKTSSKNEKITLIAYQNKNEKQIKPYSFDLYQYLTQQQIKLKVSIGQYSGNITLASGRDCFVSCKGKGDDQFQLHLNNSKNKKKLLFANYQGEQNPVVIKNIPEAILLNNPPIKISVVDSNKMTQITQFPLNEKAIRTTLTNSTNQQKKAFDAIKTNVFSYLENNIDITYKDPKLNPKHNGLSDVYIDVRWTVEPDQIKSALSNYFTFKSKHNNTIAISKFKNTNEHQKQPFTSSLYKHLLNYEAGIMVSLGKHKKHITISTSRDCFVSCKGKGDSEYQFHLSNHLKPHNLLFSPYQGETNPVVLTDVNTDELSLPIKVEFYVKRI